MMKQTKRIDFFERYLTLWVLLCMVAGIMIGQYLPGIPAFLCRLEFYSVSMPVGVLVEVPVMLMLVRVSNNTKHWFSEPQ
jgi:ACR3 family arsenite transporter